MILQFAIPSIIDLVLTSMVNIERIRSVAAVHFGFVKKWEEATQKSFSVPKVAIISSPQSYITTDGQIIKKEMMDLNFYWKPYVVKGFLYGQDMIAYVSRQKIEGFQPHCLNSRHHNISPA